MNKILKKYKQLILGITIGSLLGSIPVFAESKNIEAFFNDIKIMVNGKMVNTGEDKPFIYNSRTYLPIRYVAEELGATVRFNSNTNAVEIDSSTQTVSIATPTPKPTPTVKPTNTPIPKPTPMESNIYSIDGIRFHSHRDDEKQKTFKYIPVEDFNAKYNKDGYNISINDGKDLGSLIFNDEIILNNIALYKDYKYYDIEYEYYKSTILPLIKK